MENDKKEIEELIVEEEEVNEELKNAILPERLTGDELIEQILGGM